MSGWLQEKRLKQIAACITHPQWRADADSPTPGCTEESPYTMTEWGPKLRSGENGEWW